MCIIPYNERKTKFLKYPVKIAKPIMDNYNYGNIGSGGLIITT